MQTCSRATPVRATPPYPRPPFLPFGQPMCDTSNPPMPPHLSRPILGALHTHVAGWAGFVAVVAQGWAGLNQTSGRRGPLSLRALYIVQFIVHSILHPMVHYTVHSAATLAIFERCAA